MRKSLFVIWMIVLAFTQAFAKPADIHAARLFNKPFSTLATTSRPSRSYQYLTPGGHFIIHYDNSGYNEVPQNYTYNDSIPDFVFKAAQYLDDSFNTLHDSLGFDIPPVDNIESPEIDVYFKFDLSNYGVTQLETNQGDDTWSSYLTLSTQLGDSTIFYTYGLEGLSVTCAHELFHIFQLGYKYRPQDIFYFEMSSVWFEEHMYPDVNDYHAYVSEYAGDWNYAINHGALDYDNVGFNLYLNDRFSTKSNNIIHSIWDRIVLTNALSSIRNELEYRGISFEEALRDWGSSQVLCGPYSAPGYQYAFNDAAELETVNFNRTSDHILASASGSISLSKSPAVTYYKLTNMPASVMLFEAIFDDGAQANLICLNGNQSRVMRIGDSPIVIDGTRYQDYMIVLGSDAESMSGDYAFTAIDADQIASLYPNPLSPRQNLNLSYVLLEDNLQGRLAIYDINGRNVYSRSVDPTFLSSGLHEISFIPPVLSSGVYIAALHLDNTYIAGKFTYLK